MPATTHTKQRRAAEHYTASEMSACLLIPMETTLFYSNWALAITSAINRFCLQAQRIVTTKQESGSKVCSRVHPLSRLESPTSCSVKSDPFFYEISFPHNFQFTKGFFIIGWELNWAGSAKENWKSGNRRLASKVLREHSKVQYKQAKMAFAKWSNKCEERKIALCNCWQGTPNGVRTVPVFLSIFLSNF